MPSSLGQAPPARPPCARRVAISTDFASVSDGDRGATCASVGGMASKAPIEAASVFHRRHDLGALGVRGAEAVRADTPAMLARVAKMRDGFAKGPKAAPGLIMARRAEGRRQLMTLTQRFLSA